MYDRLIETVGPERLDRIWEAWCSWIIPAESPHKRAVFVEATQRELGVALKTAQDYTAAALHYYTEVVKSDLVKLGMGYYSWQGPIEQEA